jgi:hypothetical protein
MRAPHRTGGSPHRWRLTPRILAVVAVLTALLACVFLWLSPSSGLRAGNFSKIRPGMTRLDVDGLLGGPPRDYGAYADGAVESGDGSVLQVFVVPNAGASKPEIWEDDRNRFFIFFDNEDAVVAASKATHVRRYPKSEWLFKVRQMLRSILY